ncbi:MAG: hypothetical protein JXR58_11870 [Bacteroidales bacterium]|nr:hypothetical protein [Bacteroidales bacterium]
MKRFYKNIIAFTIFIALVSFSSCKKEHLSIYSFSQRLTGNIWIAESFVNEQSNTQNSAPNFTYEFKDDGVFTITSLETGLKKNDTWELKDNNKYLRIGNDIYLVDFLSNKLLCLYYGSVRLTLIPVEN